MDILLTVLETYGLFGFVIVVLGVGVWRFSVTQNAKLESEIETRKADRQADIEQQRTVTKMMVNSVSRMDTMQQTLDGQSAKIIELTEALGKAREEHSVLKTQYEADKKLNAVIIDGLKEESQRQDKQIIDLTGRLNHVKEQRDELKSELIAMTKERDALKSELNEANIKILDLTKRIELLESPAKKPEPEPEKPPDNDTDKPQTEKKDVA